MILSRAAARARASGGLGARGASILKQRGLACAAQSQLFVHDVTPRDGIQNEETVLGVAQKLELVERLVACGPSSVEVCSFVREDLVPAMAGAADLCGALRTAPFAVDARARGMGFAALVPNARGYEGLLRACENPDGDGIGGSPINTVVCLVSCTEAHSKANTRMSVAQALDATLPVIRAAKEEGFRVRAYASMAFDCPFEGIVDQQQVVDISSRFADAGADVVVLADTLGTATPEHVQELLPRVAAVLPVERIGLHLHNAHGRAAENVLAATALGVRHLDASLGGAGGCNFVPDAKGNISTQALVAAADQKALVHGLDRAGLDATSRFLEKALGRKLDLEYVMTQ